MSWSSPTTGLRIYEKVAQVAGQTFQPSELAKMAALVGLAWWFSRKEMQPREFLRGYLYPMCGVGFLVLLIAPEVDLGTSTLILCKESRCKKEGQDIHVA